MSLCVCALIDPMVLQIVSRLSPDWPWLSRLSPDWPWLSRLAPDWPQWTPQTLLPEGDRVKVGGMFARTLPACAPLVFIQTFFRNLIQMDFSVSSSDFVGIQIFFDFTIIIDPI